MYLHLHQCQKRPTIEAKRPILHKKNFCKTIKGSSSSGKRDLLTRTLGEEGAQACTCTTRHTHTILSVSLSLSLTHNANAVDAYDMTPGATNYLHVEGRTGVHVDEVNVEIIPGAGGGAGA